MVRKYKRKTKNGLWSKEDMERAVLAALEGQTYSSIAAATGIPRSTLIRKVRIKKQGEGTKMYNKPGASTVFSYDQEEDLANTLLYHMHGMNGFTSDEVRSLAFQLAEKLNIPHHFNKEEKMAGRDWYTGFMRRHPQLALRKPEHTSKARAEAFTKKAANEFYDLLQGVIEKYDIQPQNIFNVDETPMSTVPKSAPKIIAKKGQKQVGGLVSGERGEHITAEICFSATGNYMAPLLIFPRKNRNEEICQGAPQGSRVEFHPSGYVDTDIFFKWFEDFVEFSKPTPENKVLLLFDQHSTHTKNLKVLESAVENNIIILAFPPHTSHRLQPVDVSFNKPLSTNFGKHHNAWMRRNKNKVVTLKNFFDIFTPAYIESATVENAKSGFKKTGIWPFNRNSYSDKDFIDQVENHLAEPRDQEFCSAIQEILQPESVVSVTSHEEISKNQAAEEILLPATGEETSECNFNDAHEYSDIYCAPIDILHPNVGLDETAQDSSILNEDLVSVQELELPVVDLSELQTSSPMLDTSTINSIVPWVNVESENTQTCESNQVSINRLDLGVNKAISTPANSKNSFEAAIPLQQQSDATTKKRRSLKSKAKVFTEPESVQEVKEAKRLAESKKPKNPKKKKEKKEAEVLNQQLTAVNLNVNAPTPYFFPPIHCSYPTWPAPYSVFSSGSPSISAVPTNIAPLNMQLAGANANCLSPSLPQNGFLPNVHHTFQHYNFTATANTFFNNHSQHESNPTDLSKK